MKLKELLALLELGWFKVIDRDTELRTDLLCAISTDDSQLKTLRDKNVKCIRMYGGALMEIEVSTK